jgi:hypothetical protein
VAERRAEKEAFAARLQEEIAKTFETERVKNAIADASQHAMENLRTNLQRETAFTAFQRDLIARHQDTLFSALKDSSTIADLAKYEWREEEISDRKPKMTGYLHSVTMSAAMLRTLNAFPVDAYNKLVTAADEVAEKWDKVLSLKVANSASFRQQYPTAKPPDGPDFWNAQSALNTAVSTLTDRVLDAIKSSVVPK